jgi:hypothetical protein
MSNAMSNIRERTGAYKGERVISIYSMVIEFLQRQTNGGEQVYVSFTAETRVPVGRANDFNCLVAYRPFSASTYGKNTA